MKSSQLKSPNSPLTIAGLIVRVSLGAYFVYSGGDKIFKMGLDAFTQAVGNYKLVGPPWDAVVAYTLPWCEMIAGVALMLDLLRRGALIAMTMMTGTFCVAIGWALAKGLDISCGCHAADGKVGALNVIRLSVIFLALGFLWWLELRKPRGGDAREADQ